MKILAIGATGFVGSRVTRQLIAQGHQVALFHQGSTTDKGLDSLVHLYGAPNQLLNFKAQFEQFAVVVVLAMPWLVGIASDRIFNYIQLFRAMPDVMVWLSLCAGLGCINGILRLIACAV